MNAPLLELEGTWEDIAARAPDFAGRRLRLIVLSDGPSDPHLDVLQEIDNRSRRMNTSADTRDILREGRDGGMFGD